MGGVGFTWSGPTLLEQGEQREVKRFTSASRLSGQLR